MPQYTSCRWFELNWVGQPRSGVASKVSNVELIFFRKLKHKTKARFKSTYCHPCDEFSASPLFTHFAGGMQGNVWPQGLVERLRLIAQVYLIFHCVADLQLQKFKILSRAFTETNTSSYIDSTLSLEEFNQTFWDQKRF